MGYQHKLKKISGRIMVLVLLNLCSSTFAQFSDSTKVPFRFAGGVAVTNKGISTVPNLTLGKPAAIFDMSAGKGKLSFEPQLRFALEGKPWSFLFWWRYKLLRTERFRINIGFHPALSFKTKMITVDNQTKEDMVVRRYLAGELAPTYYLTENSSIGLYWLSSRGIEKDITQSTNLIALRGSLSNLRISEKIYLRINPQVYYLLMDGIDGFYFNSTITIGREKLPFTLSALFNQPLKTNIEIGNEFLWNVSLNYTFGKDYLEK